MAEATLDSTRKRLTRQEDVVFISDSPPREQCLNIDDNDIDGIRRIYSFMTLSEVRPWELLDRILGPQINYESETKYAAIKQEYYLKFSEYLQFIAIKGYFVKEGHGRGAYLTPLSKEVDEIWSEGSSGSG